MNILNVIDNINDVSIDTEEVVLSSLMESYTKALDVIDNANEEALDSFDIFNESFIQEAKKEEVEESTFRKINKKTGKKENILKSILMAIPRLIGLLIKKIKSLFSGKKGESTSKKITEIVHDKDSEKTFALNAYITSLKKAIKKNPKSKKNEDRKKLLKAIKVGALSTVTLGAICTAAVYVSRNNKSKNISASEFADAVDEAMSIPPSEDLVAPKFAKPSENIAKEINEIEQTQTKIDAGLKENEAILKKQEEATNQVIQQRGLDIHKNGTLTVYAVINDLDDEKLNKAAAVIKEETVDSKKDMSFSVKIYDNTVVKSIITLIRVIDSDVVALYQDLVKDTKSDATSNTSSEYNDRIKETKSSLEKLKKMVSIDNESALLSTEITCTDHTKVDAFFNTCNAVIGNIKETNKELDELHKTLEKNKDDMSKLVVKSVVNKRTDPDDITADLILKNDGMVNDLSSMSSDLASTVQSFATNISTMLTIIDNQVSLYHETISSINNAFGSGI